MALLVLPSGHAPAELAPAPKEKEITQCRGCQSADLRTVVDLGDQYVVDFVANKDLVTRSTAPLTLALCGVCHLVQLRHTVPADTLFRKFWYLSSMNEQMCAALRDVVNSAVAIRPLRLGDAVLDIGCNDGYLLGQYGPRGFVRRVGFDPAEEVIRQALNHDYADVLIADYFTAKKALDAVGGAGKKYKIITAVAMFYDLDSPVQFLREVEDCLDDDGLFVIQMNYLMAMLRNCTFDNISHEHLCYYSVQSLLPLLAGVGLRLVWVEENDVNGGSIRLFIRKISYGTAKEATLPHEPDSFAGWHNLLVQFESRIHKTVSTLNWYLETLAAREAKIYVYGASTRGTTVLQTLLQKNGSLPQQLLGAAERDSRKYGLQMVGTWTPIVSEEEARRTATHFLVLPYSFLPSIERREASWLASGGELIVPLPVPSSITSKGCRVL